MFIILITLPNFIYSQINNDSLTSGLPKQTTNLRAEEEYQQKNIIRLLTMCCYQITDVSRIKQDKFTNGDAITFENFTVQERTFYYLRAKENYLQFKRTYKAIKNTLPAKANELIEKIDPLIQRFFTQEYSQKLLQSKLDKKYAMGILLECEIIKNHIDKANKEIICN